MEYLFELFESLPRCGPGDDASTRRAFSLIPDPPEKPDILDIGCGTGVQTLELTRISSGTIVALDNHQAFLDTLMDRARGEGLADRIVPKNMSMLEMDFVDGAFDIVWSEGALYFMGFQEGLKRCRRLLKERGYMAVTEVVYLTLRPPKLLVEFWNGEYPDIAGIGVKIDQIQKEGFCLISSFTLPKSAWMESYYVPVEKELSRLRYRYKDNETAMNVFSGMQREIDIYKEYSDHYGYEFFVMQKDGD